MKKIILALTLVMVGPLAHADLLLEPYLGYYVGKSDDGTTKSDVTGVGFGGRIGFQSLGFMIGGEYMTGAWSSDTSPSTEITPSVLGVFAGYEFPILLRVYGTYGLTNKAKTKSDGVSATLEGGSFIKLGVGTTILPLVAINLEYITASYDELDGVSFSPEVKQNVYGVSVSLPLTF